MADLSVIRGRLGQIRQELTISPAFTFGPPDDAAKATGEINRLERLRENLDLIIRDLGSHESALQARVSQLKNVPRDQRYTAEQSLKQLELNVQSVQQEAQSLAEFARDLLVRNGLLNPMQKAKDFLELANELDKFVGPQAHSEIAHALQMAKPMTIGMPPAGGSTWSMGGIAGLLAFVYVAIKALQKRMQASD